MSRESSFVSLDSVQRIFLWSVAGEKTCLEWDWRETSEVISEGHLPSDMENSVPCSIRPVSVNRKEKPFNRIDCSTSFDNGEWVDDRLHPNVALLSAVLVEELLIVLYFQIDLTASSVCKCSSPRNPTRHHACRFADQIYCGCSLWFRCQIRWFLSSVSSLATFQRENQTRFGHHRFGYGHSSVDRWSFSLQSTNAILSHVDSMIGHPYAQPSGRVRHCVRWHCAVSITIRRRIILLKVWLG